MPEKSGKGFERLAEEIFSKLNNNPDFQKVERNVLIDGPDGPREIDILLTTKAFGIELKTVVECKDHKSKVSVGVIDGLVSKMTDVKANKGIIVSRSGFSSTAQQKAKRFGIELCTAHQAKHPKWNIDIEIPILVQQITPIEFNQIVAYPDLDIKIFEDSKRKNSLLINDLNVVELFQLEWNAKRIKYKITDKFQKITYSKIQPPFVLRNHLNENISINDFFVNVRLGIEYYVGNVKEMGNSQLLNNITSGEMTVFVDTLPFHNFPDSFRRIAANEIPKLNAFPITLQTVSKIKNPVVNKISRLKGPLYK